MLFICGSKIIFFNLISHLNKNKHEQNFDFCHFPNDFQGTYDLSLVTDICNLKIPRDHTSAYFPHFFLDYQYFNLSREAVMEPYLGIHTYHFSRLGGILKMVSNIFFVIVGKFSIIII
jgi:hypothetical protein